MTANWHRYETLRPDQLRSAVDECPILYWPLGLLEHHGWHLPVGYDGLKAEGICMRLAAKTGGIMLPPMWWGCGGGHGNFAWSLYQPPEASEAIVATTIERAAHMGFRAIVVVAGHYPWQPLLDRISPPIMKAHPNVLLLAGSEVWLGDAVGMPVDGDHAAHWETTYGMALFPELIEMNALSSVRTDADWPLPDVRPDPVECTDVELDPAHPLFAQWGDDPRLGASAEAGERLLTQLCERLAQRITAHVSED